MKDFHATKRKPQVPLFPSIINIVLWSHPRGDVQHIESFMSQGFVVIMLLVVLDIGDFPILPIYEILNCCL